MGKRKFLFAPLYAMGTLLHHDLNCFRCPCDTSILVFCFSLPESCKRCGRHLTLESLEVYTQCPKPFVNASETSCCLILKPTNGDFIDSYFDGCDLHIAVVDSKGFLYEFNPSGLFKVNTKDPEENVDWNYVLPISISSNEQYNDQWDQCVEFASKMVCWTSSSYNEDSWNCFTFVLKFLELTGNHYVSKEVFTQRYILPKLERAKLYIDWYRKVIANGTHEITTSVERIE